MHIEILELIEGAKKAKDLIPMGDINEAYAYRDTHPGTILMGERGGAMCPGFDFGNSPSQVKNVDFTGKTVVHTTSAGTQGVANATGATQMLTGSLVNAKAIAEYIKHSGAEEVSLVCMGLAGRESTREDTLCAEYIKSLVEGKPMDLAPGIAECKATSGAKFFRPNQTVFPEEDFWLCTEADKFDFVLRVEQGADGLMHTVKI